MRIDTPVLIVGAGPVGLSLAADLGWRGTSCTVIERSDGSILQPKMDMVGVRTMEFCRRWGIVDWVEGSPFPLDYPQDNVYVTSLTGYELGRYCVPSYRDAPLPPQSPQKRHRCPQDMFDPILQRLVGTFPTVTTRYRTELLSLEAHADWVTAEVLDELTGEHEVITASYVIGCDGAGSVVRDMLGTTMSGRGALTYTTNVIFRSPELSSLHDKGLAYRFIIIGPEGTWATLVAINGRDRWRFSIVGDGEPRLFDEAEIDAAVRRAVGIDFDFEVLTVVPWIRRELVADTYRWGRVLIAGDAAHVTSPTGGFGMNMGIGDAMDLSWKLTGVLQGWGGPGLLDSYQQERRPVAVRNVTEASGNLERMLSPRQYPPGELLAEDSPEGEAERKRFGAWYEQQMEREWKTLGIHLGYRYDESSIIIGDGTEAPPMEVTSYEQTARPGARAPHVWMHDGRSTLDLFGAGFVLLRLGPQPPPATSLVEAAAAVGMPLEVVTLTEDDIWEAYGRYPLVLVRPDGHVAWRAMDEPSDADLIVAIVTGQEER